jgi:hypothetical protein
MTPAFAIKPADSTQTYANTNGKIEGWISENQLYAAVGYVLHAP